MAARKVLIVDDAQYHQLRISRILSSCGFVTVGKIDNAEKIDEICKELCPDLVTMDLIMPGTDGMAAIETVRKALDGNVKILVISSLGTESKIAAALKAGADDFVIKPFDDSELVFAAERLMRLSSLQEDVKNQ